MVGRPFAGGIILSASPRQPVGGTHGIALSAALSKPPKLAPGVCAAGKGGAAFPPSAGRPANGPGHLNGAVALTFLFMAMLPVGQTL